MLNDKIIPIREWVLKQFNNPGRKTFFELGAHNGMDTEWLSALPGVTLHAFEPDPRNDISHLPGNVIKNKQAISDINGHIQFTLSATYGSEKWTYSSSIFKPKNHFVQYPSVKFGETIEVESITLDTYCANNNIGDIDFIWADVQGAEGNVIRGATETLKRTKYLYTEFSDREMYDGQIALDDIMKMLPNWRIQYLYRDPTSDDNVLLVRID
jgi:FkbM family methyltransferase